MSAQDRADADGRGRNESGLVLSIRVASVHPCPPARGAVRGADGRLRYCPRPAVENVLLRALLLQGRQPRQQHVELVLLLRYHRIALLHRGLEFLHRRVALL